MQQLRRRQRFVDQDAVGKDGAVRSRTHLRKGLIAAAVLIRTLAAAGIADSNRAGQLQHRPSQHLPQLGKAGGAQHRHVGHLREIQGIEAAVVRLAVSAHETRPVNAQHHMQAIQRHILKQLVVAPLQKAGVYGKHRDKSLLRHAARHGHGMSLGNAYVKKAVGIFPGELRQSGALLHGGGDGAYAPVLPCQRGQLLAEHVGEIHFCST